MQTGSDAPIRVTWWGHATVLVEDGARVLTDPILTHSLVHLRRRSGMVPRQLVHDVDAVLLSHLHVDHLHRPSLALLEPGTPALIPKGAARLLHDLPVTAVEVEAGDVIQVGDASVVVVPALHDDTRWPWSRTHGDAVGYVVRGAGRTYFAGDTDSVPDLTDLTSRVDVAVLPVGGWGPWLRGEHMNARQAAEELHVLRPSVAVPMHYGTFWPRGVAWLRPHVFHEPGRDFATHAAKVAPEVDVRVLHPGMSTTVSPRATARERPHPEPR
jgi:L-ascorbate metabolism protein UlaG (beta-lactamase superfamily)